MTSPFMTTAEASNGDTLPGGIAYAPMGQRVPTIQRYKMPLLPGEEGPKTLPPGQQPWVPRGLQSMTNLAGSISDTRALGDWVLQQTLIGLGLSADLWPQLRQLVWNARAAEVDFQGLRESEEGKALREALMALAERAKDIGGANDARDKGILAHTEWEARSRTVSVGLAFGETEVFASEISAMEELLAAAGFERVPELRERTVRNVALKAAGRFDDILLNQRTGKLYMADLKTKRKPFWTWLEMDAQLAGYARSEWMLEFDTPPEEYEGGAPEIVRYVDGPVHHVDLQEGVILHMPSDGGEPRLRRADLMTGWETMRLARKVCDARSYGRSAARERDSWWPVP